MPTAADYRPFRTGRWIFWTLRDAVDSKMIEKLAAIVESQPYSKHPQTVEFAWPPHSATRQFFLKVFHRRRGTALLKDLLRQTKARRFWRQGLALTAAGFNVPPTVMFGEIRRWGQVDRSVVLTERIQGRPAPIFLSTLRYSHGDCLRIKWKWHALAELGELVRRFHDLGFVHGDLVATNILVASEGGDQTIFYLMDNDRTRRYPPWMAGHLRKRNLVQLNRMPLAHITLQDRMRFLRSYLRAASFGKTQRDLAVWLEGKTRRRRHEVDGADANLSFRKLMTWHNPAVLPPRP